jgi:hypothetical protein
MGALAGPPLPAQDSRGPGAGAGGSDFSLTLTGRYWRPGIYGRLFITKGGGDGTASRINVHDDLELETENAPQAALDFNLGDHRLGFQYLPLTFEGKSTLTEPFIFHATTFPAGERVTSRIDIALWTFRYDYRLLEGSHGFLRIGLAGYYWFFESLIKGEGPGGSLDEHRGFSSFLPGATLSGQLRLGNFHLNAAVGGATLGSESNLFEMEGSVGVRLWSFVDLDAGYRFLHLDQQETSNENDLSIHGPFVALSLTF